MKKLSILLVVLLAFIGCSKDNTTDFGHEADRSTASVPHLFGTMLPDNQTPQTRGVANNLKVWSTAAVQKGLTVKFLNGTEIQQTFVKNTVKEWETAANVKFNFVESNQDAIIRIGFDQVRYMNASWAYTGNDHKTVEDQSKPTVNYANWRNFSEARKRNDVLRTFGQVLGLELEYRHPKFDPGWVRRNDGSIDEDEIRSYWQNELSNFISWNDLKKIVLDPLSGQINNISNTKEYDPNSIMTWLLPSYIANNIALPNEDAPIITELSAQDKAFVKSLYATQFNLFPLIEFEYTGTTPQITVTTSRNLEVHWDAGVTENFSRYEIPSGEPIPYTFTISNKFTDSKAHKIVIGELIPNTEKLPEMSYALNRFDFQNAGSAKNLKIMAVNKALTYVRINGVPNPATQTFDFTNNQIIKELYLVNIENSKVILKNCTNLETFSTSMSLEPVAAPLRYNTNSARVVDGGGNSGSSSTKPFPEKWPFYPEPKYSLNNSCLTIQNCDKLRFLGLENTRITSLDLSNLPSLEFVYLSSFADYIAGGKYDCALLKTLINTLTNRTEPNKVRGSIVVQQVNNAGTPNNFSPFTFTPVDMTEVTYNSIKKTLAAKNWDFFKAGGKLDINLEYEKNDYFRLYYRYSNPKYTAINYIVHINRAINGMNDLVILPHDGHFTDPSGRPYYKVHCPGHGTSNVKYGIGLKVGDGPGLEFSHSWLDYQEIPL